MEETQARTRRWSDWLASLSLALISAGIVIWQNSRLAVLWDISYILENSYRISLGQVPYRDFPFPYAPLTFVTQAALIKLTGRVFFHHIVYCATVAALSTLLAWRILLHVLRDTPRARLLALALTLPLTVLGVYAIYPHPFYDSDCTFVILACLLMLLHWNDKSISFFSSFITGAALVLPIFIKQNVGLVFTGSTVASLVLLGASHVYRGRQIRQYIYLFTGFIVAFAGALFLIQRISGLQNYFQWTVKFAAQRRTPALGEMIGVYRDSALKWWLLLMVVGAMGLWLSGVLGFSGIKKGPNGARLYSNATMPENSRRGLLLGISLLLLAIPLMWPVIYLFLDTDSSERAERLVNLWPLVLILSFASLAFTIIRRLLMTHHPAAKSQQGQSVESSTPFHQEDAPPSVNPTNGSCWLLQIFLPLIIIATVHGSFMSQQLWGSTYALWPLFTILVATTIASFPQKATRINDNRQSAIGNRQLLILIPLISVSLLISGFFYLRSHERLDYANLDDGDLTHSDLPPLKGLVTRGSWLPDFAELVAYTDKNIPRDEGILYLPGEDLFYYTTGRVPQFPVLMFDHTVNPYAPQEIVDLARARNIQWLIVKDDLQLEEEPLEQKDALINLLEKDFESVDSLNNYEIYKRKTPGEEDSDDEDDEKTNPQ
jgi:hypothetical protein